MNRFLHLRTLHNRLITESISRSGYTSFSDLCGDWLETYFVKPFELELKGFIDGEMKVTDLDVDSPRPSLFFTITKSGKAITENAFVEVRTKDDDQGAHIHFHAVLTDGKGREEEVNVTVRENVAKLAVSARKEIEKAFDKLQM